MVGPDTYLKYHPEALARHKRKDVIVNEDLIEQDPLSTMTVDISSVKLKSADVFHIRPVSQLSDL